MAAGSGENEANEKILRRLGEITKTPMLDDAKTLAAMRTFGKPALLPIDRTGKSAARQLMAAGIGFKIGGPAGAAIAGAGVSPLALKAGIDIGRPIINLTKGGLMSPEIQGLLIKKGLLDANGYAK